MPGSGKSTWGKKLASALKYNFIDLDDQIEEKENLKISDIFIEKGEEYFRDKEQFYLEKTINLNNTIVSTGGGTPCYKNNMEFMNKNGITIYLNANIGIISDRILKGKRQRPLFFNQSEDEIRKNIEKILSLRKGYYNMANYTFNIPDESVQTFVNKAVQLIEYSKI